MFGSVQDARDYISARRARLKRPNGTHKDFRLDSIPSEALKALHAHLLIASEDEERELERRREQSHKDKSEKGRQ